MQSGFNLSVVVILYLKNFTTSNSGSIYLTYSYAIVLYLTLPHPNLSHQLVLRMALLWDIKIIYIKRGFVESS